MYINIYDISYGALVVKAKEFILVVRISMMIMTLKRVYVTILSNDNVFHSHLQVEGYLVLSCNMFLVIENLVSSFSYSLIRHCFGASTITI